MKAKRIEQGDIASLLVGSLSLKPTAPRSAGGDGLNTREFRRYFDLLPLHIIEAYNTLISDIEEVGRESLAAAIKTGISDGHSLYDLFEDISSGVLATYLSVGDKTLSEELAEIKLLLSELLSELKGEEK